jgi:hypothetical protein
MDRALGMVLVGDRRAEQGHDTVAEELVHGAFIAVHLGQHQLESPGHEAMNFFRVKPFGERGKARDIHEEDRHLLTFPFQGTTRGENFVGEVFGRICRRRSKPRLFRRLAANRLPALETELRPWWQLGAAVRARQCETGATLQAKFRLRRIFLLAPRALYH